MPWKETCVVDLRHEFVLRSLREELPFRELCQEYGISPKTGYKWKERFVHQGVAGLVDVSRKPNTSPAQISEDILCEIIRIKNDHNTWGPLKVREVFARRHTGIELPSESTFKRILEKAGLVTKRRRRPSTTCGRIENRIVPTAPNDLWTTDFKGWWYTGNRTRCEPLTVRDGFSRFVLCANPLEDAKSLTVRRQFERLFEIYGLPKAIRSDNGNPFACTRAPLGLSQLSAWWVTLGIDLDRITPGRPDQNGAHERMHRDIAVELERSPEFDLPKQRATLETWRHSYNFERPHEALGMRVPGDVYKNSDRSYSKEQQELVYPHGYFKRKVSPSGTINIDKIRVGITTAIAGWEVGLKPTGPESYLIRFGSLCLGIIDLRTQSFKAVDNITQ